MKHIYLHGNFKASSNVDVEDSKIDTQGRGCAFEAQWQEII
jgi:hypothetical protein